MIVSLILFAIVIAKLIGKMIKKKKDEHDEHDVRL